MKHDSTFKLVAVLLTIICAFAYVVYEPAAAIAQDIMAEEQLSENAQALNSVWQTDTDGYSPLIGELIEYRGESEKRFRRADGAIEYIAYNCPVSYLSDGEWLPIDNTLTLQTDSDGDTVYVNTGNDFLVKIAASMDCKNLIGICIQIGIWNLDFA